MDSELEFRRSDASMTGSGWWLLTRHWTYLLRDMTAGCWYTNWSGNVLPTQCQEIYSTMWKRKTWENWTLPPIKMSLWCSLEGLYRIKLVSVIITGSVITGSGKTIYRLFMVCHPSKRVYYNWKVVCLSSCSLFKTVLPDFKLSLQISLSTMCTRWNSIALTSSNIIMSIT